MTVPTAYVGLAENVTTLCLDTINTVAVRDCKEALSNRLIIPIDHSTTATDTASSFPSVVENLHYGRTTGRLTISIGSRSEHDLGKRRSSPQLDVQTLHSDAKISGVTNGAKGGAKQNKFSRYFWLNKPRNLFDGAGAGHIELKISVLRLQDIDNFNFYQFFRK